MSEASGLWVTPSTDLLFEDRSVELLHSAINEGKRCFVEVSVNQLDVFNRFLAPYDLSGTRIGMSASTLSDDLTHPRSLRVSRSTAPGAFRDAVLFDGVDSVVVSSAQVLDCRGDAVPVLSVPVAGVMLTDLKTDRRLGDDKTPVGVMGLGGAEHQVLATTGALFFDACVGLMGHQFSGIEENGPLALNVLRWLTGDMAAVASAT